MNAYCDIDGLVKEQKTKDLKGNWAKCQNSYECSSNLCSDGECIEVKDIVAKGNAIKGLAVKILCRLSNMFDSTNYNQCLYDYLGATTDSSSGGSGGGSSSA